MEAAISSAVRAAVAETITAAQVPGIALAVARGQGGVAHLMVGADATGRPLTRDSLFPVASITKLATALAVLRLVDTGKVSLDELLASYLPQAAAAQPGVTLRTLLSHTSGLPLDIPSEKVPYKQGLDWTALARACLQIPLEAAPLTRVQYSNTGYGLLALIVEHQTSSDFSSALSDLVLEPLGVEGYLGREPLRPPATIANVRSRHAGTPLEPFNSSFWRSLALPWAGLVTTVVGALGLVRAFRGVPDGFLRPQTLAEATRNQAGQLGGGFAKPLMWPFCPWGLGPELRDAKTPHQTPHQASPDSFGHTGASGCIAWADPQADVAWAILGARTADSGWLIRRAAAIGTAILAND